MNYQESAKLHNSFPTGIHTRISDSYRISSAYRKYSNPYFESWGWETLLWNGDSIEWQYEVLSKVEDVVNLHNRINRYFWDEGEFYKED